MPENQPMSSQRFGDWLKRERRARGLRQQDLEVQANLGLNYVSKIERGRVGLPEDDTRGRIHRVLGTSDDDLVEAGILRKHQVGDRLPVYLTNDPHQAPARAVHELRARYDAEDPRLMLVARVSQMTDTQVRAILQVMEAMDTYAAGS